MEKNLYYFVSDVHLGLEVGDAVLRERKFASFLSSLPQNTKALYLLGDIFDFWYEYRNVIPRRFTRTLGALASLVDRGVEVYFFNGNHDIWTYSYFEQEIGMKILQQPYIVDIAGKRFCLGHGDGLGKGDFGYKLLNGTFKSRFLQWLFSGVHPRWAFGLAHLWSKHNRLAHEDNPWEWRGKDERIVKFAQSLQQERGGDIDYFIFGHFHNRTQIELDGGARMYILGEWIHNFDYIVFDGKECHSLNIE